MHPPNHDQSARITSPEEEIPLDTSLGTDRQVWRKRQAERNALLQQPRGENAELANMTNCEVRQEKSSQEIARELQHKELTQEIQQVARKFTYMNMLWLRPSDTLVFNLEPDPEYDERNRFKSMEEQHQGILAELRAEIPKRLHAEMGSQSFIRIFTREMSQARSNAAARVRQSGPFIFDCLESFKDAEKRAEQFRNDIGFTTVDGVSRYESFAPILYKIDPIQTAPKWTIFRNPILMRTCSALLRGGNSIQGAKDGEITAQSCHTTNESKWGVRSITPAIIAMSCVLTRWAASNDKSFQPRGSLTKINYQEDYELYLKYLHKGIHVQAPSVLDILDTWNQVFYPRASEELKIVPSTGKNLDVLLGDLEAEGAEEKEHRAKEMQQSAQRDDIGEDDSPSISPAPSEPQPLFNFYSSDPLSPSTDQQSDSFQSMEPEKAQSMTVAMAVNRKAGNQSSIKRKRVDEKEKENVAPKPSKQQRKSKRIGRQ